MLKRFWEGRKDNVAERPVFRPHFPIQHPLFLNEAEQVKDKLIQVIPWELIEQHEAQALKNHKRTIEQLAQQQCGLRASEAVAVLEDRPWRRMPVEEAYDRLAEIVDAFIKEASSAIGHARRRVPPALRGQPVGRPLARVDGLELQSKLNVPATGRQATILRKTGPRACRYVNRAARKEVVMAWKIGDVQTTLDGPGFVIQRLGRSPSLILAFEDEETAGRCAEMMKMIVAEAKMITGT
jgi:hypothetical protein